MAEEIKEDKSKADPTPGPWHVEPLQWDHGATLAIIGTNGVIVAEIGPDPDLQTDDEPNADTVVRHPQDEPNAALIAAAPELLEACQMAKKYLEPDLVEPGRTVFWKLVAALIKAGVTL